MASSDSATYSNSIPKKCQNSNNYGGAAINEYKSKSIDKYIRNTNLSCIDTLNKTAIVTNDSPRHLHIV